MRMYLFQKPDDARIRRFLADQSRLDFTYASVGSTMEGHYPLGYKVDHHRICLGTGLTTFDIARRALRDWQHFKFDWIELHRPQADPEPGQTVGVLAQALGLWVLNACRVVYVVDEQLPIRRSALAYGTLPDHAESGEERFQVEWNADDDSVWYDILAYSRPNQWLSRLAYPYVRCKQKQFARGSMRAMQVAISWR